MVSDKRLQVLADHAMLEAACAGDDQVTKAKWDGIADAILELQQRRAADNCPDCRDRPTRKVGEETPHNHAFGRHNLTRHLCEACFRKLMGDRAVSAADEMDALLRTDPAQVTTPQTLVKEPADGHSCEDCGNTLGGYPDASTCRTCTRYPHRCDKWTPQPADREEVPSCPSTSP